jgi:hypothetical protein
LGIVYVLVNPAFENYVKIGKTTNLEQRLKSLDNTSVPLPFRCVYAVEVNDESYIERLLHQTFADFRTRKTREFFDVDAQRVISAMKLTGGKDVTPKNDIAEDEEGIQAIEKVQRKQRSPSTLFEAGLRVGDIIYFANDNTKTAEVVDAKKIVFEDNLTSLSASALELLHREGYTWKKVNGWNYWMFEDETIAERLSQIIYDNQDDEG